MVINFNHPKINPIINDMVNCLIDNNLELYNQLKGYGIYVLTYMYRELPNILFGSMLDKEATKRKASLESKQVIEPKPTIKNDSEEYNTLDSIGW